MNRDVCFLLIIADVSTGGDMSPLLLPGRLQLAVCGNVTPVPTSDWDPRYQSRHHEVLLSPWIRSVVGHLCSLGFFSTKVGMIGVFFFRCKRQMILDYFCHHFNFFIIAFPGPSFGLAIKFERFQHIEKLNN